MTAELMEILRGVETRRGSEVPAADFCLRHLPNTSTKDKHIVHNILQRSIEERCHIMCAYLSLGASS